MMIDSTVALASEMTGQENMYTNTPFPKFDTEMEVVRLKFHLIEE
ncbi:MAG TPA: hypothetical protein VIK71_05270 [Flavobacteriales bacterium]